MTKHLEQENGALKKILIGNLLTNTNVISENPLLSGKTFYSINYSTKYKDVMTQNVSHFGRETTAWSIVGNSTFGYSVSTESAHAFQRARHRERTVNNPYNSDVAKNFRNDALERQSLPKSSRASIPSL